MKLRCFVTKYFKHFSFFTRNRRKGGGGGGSGLYGENRRNVNADDALDTKNIFKNINIIENLACIIIDLNIKMH